jgi:hypothetical protein
MGQSPNPINFSFLFFLLSFSFFLLFSFFLSFLLAAQPVVYFAWVEKSTRGIASGTLFFLADFTIFFFFSSLASLPVSLFFFFFLFSLLFSLPAASLLNYFSSLQVSSAGERAAPWVREHGEGGGCSGGATESTAAEQRCGAGWDDTVSEQGYVASGWEKQSTGRGLWVSGGIGLWAGIDDGCKKETKWCREKGYNNGDLQVLGLKLVPDWKLFCWL